MPSPHCRQDGDMIVVRLPCSAQGETSRGGRTNARAAHLSLALTDKVDGSEKDVPYSLLLLLTSRYGKSSLLRRGSRWLAYLRVVGGCYIDRCLDGGSWQLWLARRGRADHHHDHGYDDDDDRERPIGITHGKVVVCRYLATTR